MEIKQFDWSEKSALLSFLKIAYPDNPRHSKVEFWEWHFPKNPFAETDNLPIWIVKDGTEIVGHLGAIPVKLKIGNEQKKAIWILDLVVRPDYRRKGLGKKLVNAAEKFCPLGLGMNTAEQHSTSLLESLGWKKICNVPRYNKLLFPGEALREISKVKPLRQFANFCFAPLRPKFIKDFFNKNKNLRFVKKFDPSFDDLWREASIQWTCSAAREAEILKWQFSDQPKKKFDVLGFYEDEKLLGYTVLYFRQKENDGALAKAAITDVCYHPSKPTETVDALLLGALQITLERRAGALVTDVLDSLIEQRLKFFGFSRVKNPLQLLVKSKDYQTTLDDPKNWFITRGDSDTSIFEHPNL
ncbi:MAG TPA: GNAT family N-acetyltransferase [Pyrinomonadaceae bacterium]|nr:GNAT family N-acetyltransferase [Pyrinomonadaceae bacterium]